MRHRQVRWVAVLLLVPLAGTAHAQNASEGWSVSVDAVDIATRGNDIHVGDVFTERQTLSGTFSDSRLDYGVQYDPIVTRMRNNWSGIVTVVHRPANWGGGMRGWRSDTDAATDGSRRTAASTATSQSITGIRLWDNSVVPVTNEQEPSGISPVTFTADNSLSAVRIEGFAERLWISGPRLSVAARLGVAHARIENSRAEGQTQRAFVQDTGGGSTRTLVNDITLDSTSDSTASLTGPMLALAGNATAGRLRIDWLLGQSVLFGTAETSGEWRDVDNIRETISGAAPLLETRTVLSGLIEASQETRAVVPVMELQLKGSVYVTRRLAIGAGVFSSSWFSLPVAPAFSIPDDWTDLQGTGWRQQTRDVTFAGISVSASLEF